jgi:hypothetical protein
MGDRLIQVSRFISEAHIGWRINAQRVDHEFDFYNGIKAVYDWVARAPCQGRTTAGGSRAGRWNRSTIGDSGMDGVENGRLLDIIIG